MEDPRKLREAAARCFRLARSIGNDADVEALFELGRTLEQRAVEIEATSRRAKKRGCPE
jgi:hypothetical protein